MEEVTVDGTGRAFPAGAQVENGTGPPKRLEKALDAAGNPPARLQSGSGIPHQLNYAWRPPYRSRMRNRSIRVGTKTFMTRILLP
jgi:hypothetical protein